MFKQFGAPELLIVAVLILLLFGAKRLPDAARGLGRSLRIFKAETKGLTDDDAADAAAPATPAAGAQAATPSLPSADAPAPAPTPAPASPSEAVPTERAEG